MNINKESLRLQLTAFHDAELIGMNHDRKQRSLELLFLDPNSRTMKIYLGGVIAFRCVDFGLQNVVSRFLVHGINVDLSVLEIHARTAWISETSDGEQLQEMKCIELRSQQVLNGECSLIQIEPSWGAELVVLSFNIYVVLDDHKVI